MRHAPEIGIEAKLTGVDWPAIRDRAFSRTDKISAGGRDGRAESDEATLIEGRARFTSPHELSVDDGTRVTADQIVLATGARPVIPPPIAESGVGYHTSDTVMRMDELPASMVIVGGGYIAAELAHLFSSLGVSIRIVNQAESLLETFDPEVPAGSPSWPTSAGTSACRPRSPARTSTATRSRSRSPPDRRSAASCCW